MPLPTFDSSSNRTRVRLRTTTLVSSDPNWASVVLLAGNDNAANGTATFLDQSNSAKSLTAVGNAVYSNAQKPTGMSTSIALDGTGDAVSAASSADFGYGTGDFTVEWMMRVTLAVSNPIDHRTAGNDIPFTVYITAAGSLRVFSNNADQIIGADGVIVATTWQHCAFARSGTSNKLFVAGTQVGSTWTDGSNFAARPFVFGYQFDAANGVNGFMSNIRVTKGVARYTSNFTPPTLPLPTAST